MTDDPQTKSRSSNVSIQIPHVEITEKTWNDRVDQQSFQDYIQTYEEYKWNIQFRSFQNDKIDYKAIADREIANGFRYLQTKQRPSQR